MRVLPLDWVSVYGKSKKALAFVLRKNQLG